MSCNRIDFNMSFSICQFLVVVSVAVLGMTVNVSMSARDRQKSPDDGGPLESDVEHLTRQVTSINARLNDDMSTEAAEVKANCERTFKDSLDKTIAFYAWSNDNPVQAPAHGTLILNHAGTNIGNAYNTRTGIFTAPVSGLYYFQTTFLSYHQSQYVLGAIYVGDQMMVEGISDPQHGYYEETTINTIVHVNAGEDVYVKNTDNAARDYYGAVTTPHTTFSGFLMNADE